MCINQQGASPDCAIHVILRVVTIATGWAFPPGIWTKYMSSVRTMIGQYILQTPKDDSLCFSNYIFDHMPSNLYVFKPSMKEPGPLKTTHGPATDHSEEQFRRMGMVCWCREQVESGEPTYTCVTCSEKEEILPDLERQERPKSI